MVMKRKPIVVAVVSALSGALFAMPAMAVEKIEVTGSNIKRIDTETSSPVEVITRAEIERTGAATVNDVLQRITGAGAALDDRFTNGFAPGGGSLNLRGLGFNSTLVLINGRRMPTYPFAQQVGTAQGFNDINSIPLAAVERIDILKDGASAIYGADAVAGVVNIILRQDYRGLEIAGGLGQSSRHDGKQKNVSLAGGIGSLSSDRFNVLFGLNYSTRDETMSSARPWGYTEDLRSQGGSDRRSAYGFPGTMINIDTGASFYNVGAACGPTTQQSGSSIARGYCRYDRPTLGSLMPASDKTGFYTKANFAVTPDVTAFAEVLYTQNKYNATGWPAGTTDDVGLGSNYLPPNNPINPFPGHYSFVAYRFADVGNRGDTGTSDTSRLLLGLKGTTAGWDWEAAVNTNRIKIDDVAKNNTLNSHTLCLTNPAAAASYAAGGDPLGNGTLAQIFAANPAYATYFKNQLAGCAAAFAKYGYYNYINPAANAAGVADYLRWNSARAGRSNLDGFDVRASRDLMQLGGGALGLAVGLESRKEKVSDVPDEQLQTGDTLAISAAQAFGERKVSAAYAELNAPITKELEANLAVRRDSYSGNGSYSATSPKIGVKYQPISSLLFRATASEAFRAPSLFETSPAQQTSFAYGMQDPVKCPVFDANNPNCVIDVRRVQSGNPNLKPEKSKAYTFGIVAEPTRDLSLSLDIWSIHRQDEIGAFGDQLLINLYATNPAIVVRNSQGVMTQLNQVPVQLNRTMTWGTDWNIAWKTDLGAMGKLATKVGYSQVGSYKFSSLDDNGVATVSEYNGTYSQPKYRTTWDFAWNRQAWEVDLNGYGVGGYTGLGKTVNVSSYQIWNLAVVYRGIQKTELRLGVNNLFDKGPSFDDESSGANAGYNPQWGDPIGRYYTLSAKYKF